MALYIGSNKKRTTLGSLSVLFATYEVVTGIAVTTPPTKTQYSNGEVFDPTGMVVTATYSNGTTKKITNYTIINGNQLSSDMPFVIISYTENGTTVTTEYKLGFSCTVKILFTGNQAGAALSTVNIGGQSYSGNNCDWSASTSVTRIVLAEFVVEAGTVVECINNGNTYNGYTINGTSVSTDKGMVHSYNINSDVVIAMIGSYTPPMSFGTMTMPELSSSSILINEIGVLPSDYISVEYLESTGTQYIDTGFKPTPNTAIEMDFQMTSTANQQRLFANYSAGAEDSSEFVTEVYTTDGTFKFCYQNGKPNWIATGVPVDAQRHTIKLDGYNKLFSLDNYTASLAGYTATNNATRNLYLLWTAYTDQDNHIKASARIYSCKIYDNGILVRDLVPAVSNGTAYMYDIINHVAYKNAGSDAFIVQYKDKIVTSIAVTTPPTKTEYQIGDIFDPTGMVVTATYSDNTTAVIDNYTIANGGQVRQPAVSSMTPYITITYTENGTMVSTSYKINELLCKIKISGTNVSAEYTYVEINGTQYIGNSIYGTTLIVPKGTVAKCYVRTVASLQAMHTSQITLNDSVVVSNPKTTDNTIYEYTIKGDTKFYLSHIAGGQTSATQCSITEETPTLKALESIAVTTPPTKTQYSNGEVFDKTGMIVTGTFDDGTTYNVTPYVVITNGDNLSEDNKSVTIAYTVGSTTVTTSYEVEIAPSLATATITLNGSGDASACYITYNGAKYYNATATPSFEANIGGIIYCFADKGYDKPVIKLNGNTVVQGEDDIEYAYTVHSNATIALEATSNRNRIYITEQTGAEPDEPTLISFSINESGNTTTYQAEEGMTWGEWVNSEYNDDGSSGGVAPCIIEYDMIYHVKESLYVYYPMSTNNWKFPTPNDLIVANAAYELSKD